MARASVWGLGTALAYRSLDPDAQAELLCLYHAARHQEGEEAKVVLASTAAELIHAYLDAKNSAQTEQPTKPRQVRGTEQRELADSAPRLDTLFGA